MSWVRSWSSLLQAGTETMGNAVPDLFDWYNLLEVVIETAVFFNWRSDCDDQQSPKHVLTYSMNYQSPCRFLQILDNTKILPLNTRLDIKLITNKYRVGFQGTQVLHPAWLYSLFQKISSTSRETFKNFLAGVTEVVERRVENGPT